MFAGVHIDAVRAALHRHIPERHILAVHRMDRPHTVLLRVEVLHAHILAVVELNQRRIAVTRARLVPSPLRWAANNLSRPHDSDVLRVGRRDEAQVALRPVALPAHLRHWVVRHVRRAQQARAILNPQHHPAAQRQRARQIVPRGHHHLAAAKRRAALNRLLDRQCVLGLAIAGRAVVAHA